nr:hypothetical protein [Tanacetum cinerariifolium]
MEILQARENLIEAIEVFLKKYDQIPSEEKCIALLRAEDKFFKQAAEKGLNKQAQKKQKEKIIAELLAEEQAARINSLFQDHNPPKIFISLDGDDDDDDYDKEKEKSVTFSNPLFNSNDDFISSDDESLSDKDVQEDNVKIYSNPLFEFDEEYISSDVNPLFDEVLEDIESKDSYGPNLDELTFLVTPLSDSNEDKNFTPGDDVKLLLHHDLSIPKMSVASILEEFTDEPTLEENDDLFDLEPKNDDLFDLEPKNDDLMSEDKIFDPGICVKFFSPTYVSLPFTDHHYLFFTYVVRILLLNITYPVVSPFLLSTGSEDTIFDPGIFGFHFSHRSGTFISLNVYPNTLNESPIEICSSTCFTPNITMIWGESS